MRTLALLLAAPTLAFTTACGGTVFNNVPDDGGDDAGSDAPINDAPVSDTIIADSPKDVTVDSPLARTPMNHRPAPITCKPSPSVGGCTFGGPGGGPPGACRVDSDCKAGTNGHCAAAAGGIATCACFYDECTHDSDCKGESVCACSDSPYESISNSCAPAGNCKVDADCGAGGFCSPSSGAGCADSVTGYFCHTPSDECVDDSDCAEHARPGPVPLRRDEEALGVRTAAGVRVRGSHATGADATSRLARCTAPSHTRRAWSSPDR